MDQQPASSLPQQGTPIFQKVPKLLHKNKIYACLAGIILSYIAIPLIVEPFLDYDASYTAVSVLRWLSALYLLCIIAVNLTFAIIRYQRSGSTRVASPVVDQHESSIPWYRHLEFYASQLVLAIIAGLVLKKLREIRLGEGLGALTYFYFLYGVQFIAAVVMNKFWAKYFRKGWGWVIFFSLLQFFLLYIVSQIGFI